MTSVHARAVTPRGEVVLLRRSTEGGEVLELRVNGVFVMDTCETRTERAMAIETLAVTDAPGRVLVGGLGLGFTARALLADPRVREVDVVEIEQSLIDWTRDGTIPDRGMLSDDRLRLIHEDVRDVVDRVVRPSYDVILLDVDNGPANLVYDANAVIYAEPFLRRVREALHPGGLAVLWSAAAAPALLATMTSVFDDAEERAIDVRLGNRDEQYFLYRGTRDPHPQSPAV